MKNKFFVVFIAIAAAAGTIAITHSALRNSPDESVPHAAQDPETMSDSSADVAAPSEATDSEMSSSNASETTEAPRESKPAARNSKKKILTGAEGFIAGPDWEFDGFVSGGQAQEVKSMFAVNDLLYLNVGFSQGIQAGDRLGIYKRGDRIRDPQTGRFLGYEVRRVAVTEVTDKIDDETCSARVVRSSDSIEIGDLVRRE